MDFLDPKKKRAQIIRLYIGYGLVAVAIGIAAIIILYAALGYGVDSHSGQVIQNGLVFISSQPRSADVKVVGSDNKQQPPATTNTRLTIPAGEYTITISKQGYRSWQRSIVLEGGSVERLVYPFLFPTNLVTSEIQHYTNQPGFLTQSPDHHFILLQKPDNIANFEVFDTSNPKSPSKTVGIPAGLLSDGPNPSLQVMDWSSNNKTVLMKHNFGTSSEFIVFNSQAPETSLNINKALNTSPVDVAFYNQQADQVYVQDATGLLQQANLTTHTLTPLLNNISQFKANGSDMLEYITTAGAPTGKAFVELRTNNTNYHLRDLPTSSSYLLGLSQFSGHWYVVVGAPSEGKAYVYQDPINALSDTTSNTTFIVHTMHIKSPKYLSFSANARFVELQNGQEFSVYDAEADHQFHYQLNQPIDGSQATWMDGHRLMSISNGQLLIFDFDGTNAQLLNKALGGTRPGFDQNFQNEFSLAPSSKAAGSFGLTSTALQTK